MSTRGRRGPAPKPLTDAMKRFLLDTGKYFYMWTRTGRTALALAKRGIITIESSHGGGSRDGYTLTALGESIVAKLRKSPQ